MNAEDLIQGNVYIARFPENPQWDSMFLFIGLTTDNRAKLKHRVYLSNQGNNQRSVLVDDSGSWLEGTKFETPSQELVDWFWNCIDDDFYHKKPKYNDLIYTTL